MFFPNEQSFTLHSNEFFLALKKYATGSDCVSLNNPFDLSQRKRVIMEEGTLPCSQSCLGKEFCIFDALCRPGDYDFRPGNYEQFAFYFESSLESCAAAPSCPGCVVSSSSCGLCVGDVDPGRCLTVDGKSSEEECQIGGGVYCPKRNHLHHSYQG